MRLLPRPLVVAVASAGLVLPLALLGGSATATGPTDEPPSRAKAGEVLYAQRADLGVAHRAPGMPAAGTPPGRQLVQARVRIDVRPTHEHVDVRLRLGGTPVSGAPSEQATVGLGRLSGGNCEINNHHSSYLFTSSGTEQRVVGNTGTGSADFGPRPEKPWNCVVVILEPSNQSTAYDAFVGRLRDTYEKPKLGLKAVEVLGAKQKRLSLARGTWTGVDVTVRNSGVVPARRLVLSGKGKGLKVRRGTVGLLPARSATTVRVRVKPTVRKVGKLRLTVKAPGVRGTRALQVRSVAPPPRPRAGSYRSQDGDVRFRVSKGRITGFRVSTRTRCGGAGSIPTYTNSTYDFPRTKVPRNGIVEAQQRGKVDVWNWSASLQLRIAGTRATQGSFRYFNGAGWCSASEAFTARRVGG